MKRLTRRPWTKAEKWLLVSPLFVGVGVLMVAVVPGLVRKKLGVPNSLSTSVNDSLTGIALSRDGRVLVASQQTVNRKAVGPNTIFVWEAATLKPLASITRPKNRTRLPWDDATMCVAASPDGSKVAYGTYAGTSAVFDRKKHAFLWKKPGNVDALEFSPDGKWLGLHYGNWPIRPTYQVVDAATGRLIHQWSPKEAEKALAFSPDGKYIASLGGRPLFDVWMKTPNSFGDIELRSTDTWTITRTFHLPNTNALAFAPNGKSLVATAALFETPFNANQNGSLVRCFDIASGRVRWEKNTRNDKTQEISGAVIDGCFSPDGTTIALFCLDAKNRVVLLDTDSGRVQRVLTIPTTHFSSSALPHALAFTADGKRLFARDNNAIFYWDID